MALVPEHIRNLSPYIPGMTIDEVKRKFGLTAVMKIGRNPLIKKECNLKSQRVIFLSPQTLTG